jgi:hypothetical protein
MNQRSTSTDGPRRATPVPSETRGQTRNGESTSEALVAVARDTLDVATELVRDGVTLARLEAEQALRNVTPRIAWGTVAIVCAATASVCAIIAIMIGLGAIVPSIAWRLVILAAALFVVAFFGSVRAIRPEAHNASLPANAREAPVMEGRPTETFASRRAERLSNTILPPPNA